MNMNYFSNLTTLEFSVFQDEHLLGMYPNWMIRYFTSLTDGEKWAYFLDYRNVVNQMLSDYYLIDRLKWILKQPNIELEYDLYVQARFDPDFFADDVFKPDVWEKLNDQYSLRFKEEYQTKFKTSESQASSPDGQEDTLPY